MNTNNTRAIGVFDSGIGGLTAMKELIAIAPDEDIIYFGDTARALMAQLPDGLRNHRGGSRKYFVSEDTASFRKTCEIFVGEEISETPRVVRVDNM